MPLPLRIFIGWDDRETAAYHVLAHSIIRRSSIPVAITPVRRAHLPEFTRRRGKTESTEFSLSRFLVPRLSEPHGWSIFMDCDFLCLADIAELLQICEQQADCGVLVCQHDYTPKTSRKFQGAIQTTYPRKNWSSLMAFNMANMAQRNLTVSHVNEASPLDLHRLKWMDGYRIGRIPLAWNWLVGEYRRNAAAKMLHYTLGGPWFPETRDCPQADLWRAEFQHMTGGLCATC